MLLGTELKATALLWERPRERKNRGADLIGPRPQALLLVDGGRRTAGGRAERSAPAGLGGPKRSRQERVKPLQTHGLSIRGADQGASVAV